MVEVAFFVGAIGALGGAIAVVLLRNPFYSVLALVIHLVFLAGICQSGYASLVAGIQDFLIAFEAASLLLMLAAVAAIILAGKKKQPSKGPVS